MATTLQIRGLEASNEEFGQECPPPMGFTNCKQRREGYMNLSKNKS